LKLRPKTIILKKRRREKRRRKSALNKTIPERASPVPKPHVPAGTGGEKKKEERE